MASLVSKSYSKKLLRLISWGHWFTFFNICAAILLSSIYLFADSSPETLLGKVYLVTNWFSHMAFLTFVSFILIVFPITLLFPYTRFIRGFASLVFTLILVLLVLDGFTYRALGYHLNASSFEQILELINNTIEKDSFGFYTTVALVSTLILAFQLVVSNYAWKHIHQLQQTVIAKFATFGLIGGFIFSHVTHIWADANLEYDILKQDTLFPVSYPATAKTLLTKYGLFDKSYYLESKNDPLAFNSGVPSYPSQFSCNSNTDNKLQRSAILVLNKKSLSAQLIEQFAQRATTDRIRLGHHIDNANSNDAWFNFFYGLPTIYQESVLSANTPPVLSQLVKAQNGVQQFTVIADKDAATPEWVAEVFTETSSLNTVQSLIFGSHFKKLDKGLHIYYFDNKDNYQLSLFVDALLLSQKKKKIKDIIWVSSLGNIEQTTELTIKPTLLLWPETNKSKLRVLSSQMDIAPSLIHSWLNCSEPTNQFSTGHNLITLKRNRIIANTNETGLFIFKKDKSVLIDNMGNFQGYSRQLNKPISIKPDYPLMINGVRNIKSFVGQPQ